MSLDSKSSETQYSGSDRRRAGWSSFRDNYPVLIKVCAVVFLLLVAFNIWLGVRRSAYASEIVRLRDNMSQAEREKSDLIVQSEKDRLRVAVELVKRQARWAPALNLSIDIDSGMMFLARDGALLRKMPAAIEPGMVPGSDSAIPTFPRGERSIVEVKKDGPTRILLNGGLEITTAGDTTTADIYQSGEVAVVRISAADMKAILPNIAAGMLVYIY